MSNLSAEITSELESSEVASSPSPPSVHLPQLDGARGLAIIMVMMLHSGAILRATGIGKLFQFGWIGVDLFFVLSGFLITRILLRSRSHEGYWRRFYSRRILRIWPLYYAFILAMLLMVAVFHHLPALARMPVQPSFITPLAWYVILAQNLDPASVFASRDVGSITWSLCIEEHFYLVWPLLVRRLNIDQLKYVLGSLLLLLPFARLAAYYAVRGHMTFPYYYQMVTRFTPFHLDGLAAGSLLAIFWNDTNPRKYRNPFQAMFVSGLLASVALMVFAQESAAFAFTFTAVAVLFAGFIGLSLTGWQRPLLINPGLRYTGTISYGLYLIHPTIFGLFQAHSLYARIGLASHTYVAEILAALLAVGASILIATLSWKYFESPILRLKNRMAPE